MTAAVFKQLEERFKAPVIEAYAMTENSHQMTSNQLPPGKRKPGSVGQGTGTRFPPTHHTDSFLRLTRCVCVSCVSCVLWCVL